MELSSHVPPFVAGTIILVCSCFPDKEVPEVSHVLPPELAVHVPKLVHWPGTQFVGQRAKEQGIVRVVEESAHVPPYVAGVTVRVCVLVPD
jgi:hypothetical protein